MTDFNNIEVPNDTSTSSGLAALAVSYNEDLKASYADLRKQISAYMDMSLMDTGEIKLDFITKGMRRSYVPETIDRYIQYMLDNCELLKEPSLKFFSENMPYAVGPLSRHYNDGPCVFSQDTIDFIKFITSIRKPGNTYMKVLLRYKGARSDTNFSDINDTIRLNRFLSYESDTIDKLTNIGIDLENIIIDNDICDLKKQIAIIMKQDMSYIKTQHLGRRTYNNIMEFHEFAVQYIQYMKEELNKHPRI